MEKFTLSTTIICTDWHDSWWGNCQRAFSFGPKIEVLCLGDGLAFGVVVTVMALSCQFGALGSYG